MPTDLQIIRAKEFVRLGAREHLDFEASKEALRTLAQSCRKRGLDRALLDLRDLPVPRERLFKPAQLAELIGTFKEAGFTRRQRLAVLYKTDPHKGIRMFAFIGTFKGWHVRAFSEFEPALLWLSAEIRSESGPAGEEIPIQTGAPTRQVKVKVRRVRTEAPGSDRSVTELD
ncbi:MAG TPA: hypothetical protein VGR78_06910 [Verrucomicrobiae bacterium]|jgi:hypothetical protein|nr:hypothetical protein [Verrucomicrobiae bacterium]